MKKKYLLILLVTLLTSMCFVMPIRAKVKYYCVYNTTSKGGIAAFNLEGIFSQDTALYLDHYNICVIAVNHCAKVLKEEINIKNTCRISLYFYNTKEEIDKLIEALKDSKDLYKIVL